MSFVYILKSEKTARYYIGSTTNLDRRLDEHNSGQTASLLYQRPLKIAFSKRCVNITEARMLEQKLKRYKNRRILEQIIKDGKMRAGP